MTLSKDDITGGSYLLISSTDHDYYIWFNEEGNSSDPQIPDRIGLEIPFSAVDTASEISKIIIQKLNETQEFFLNVNSTDILEIQLANHGDPLNPPSSGTTNLKFKIISKGQSKGNWILRPRPVYIHPKMEQVTEVFSYEEAYNKIPTLLVSIEQLDELKSRDELVLPTKSNIILLDYTSTIDANPLNKLIFTILMEYIGDDYFSVFLTGSSGTTTISYNTAFLLWYYLLAKYYNVTLEGVDLMFHIVMGTKKVTDYVLEDIPRIVEKYESLQTRSEIYQFYQEYIEEPFIRPYENEKPTIPIMSETLRKIDSEMWEYVENRLNTAENVEQDIRFLLDELYASMVLSFDRYRDKPIVYQYIPMLLQFTTQITTNIKATDSYKLVYNLKPFHTEILDLARNKILIDDKFNWLAFEDPTEMFYQLILADLLHMSDQLFFHFSPKKNDSSLALISSFIPDFYLPVEEELNLKDKIPMYYLLILADLIHLSDRLYFSFTPKNGSPLSLLSFIYRYFNLPVTDEAKVDDESTSLFLMLLAEVLHLSDRTSFSFIPKKSNSTLPLISEFYQYLNFPTSDESKVEDTKKSLFLLLMSEVLRMSDRTSFSFTPKNDSSLSLRTIIEQFIHFILESDHEVADYFEIRLQEVIGEFLRMSDRLSFYFTPKSDSSLSMRSFLNTIINTSFQSNLLMEKTIALIQFCSSFFSDIPLRDQIHVRTSPYQGSSILDMISVLRNHNAEEQMDNLALGDNFKLKLSKRRTKSRKQ